MLRQLSTSFYRKFLTQPIICQRRWTVFKTLLFLNERKLWKIISYSETPSFILLIHSSFFSLKIWLCHWSLGISDFRVSFHYFSPHFNKISCQLYSYEFRTAIFKHSIHFNTFDYPQTKMHPPKNVHLSNCWTMIML